MNTANPQPTVTTRPTPPTLRAVLSESGQTCSVWCRYCDAVHTHGIDSGHAVAHCFVKDSPYHDTGYSTAIGAGTVDDLRPLRSERRRPRCSPSGECLHGWRREKNH